MQTLIKETGIKYYFEHMHISLGADAQIYALLTLRVWRSPQRVIAITFLFQRA
ncbi:hypothetical protein OGY07_02625 [Citrobacter sp. Cs237]|uniref:hypothetical protein n=1 Tax=Citrobacter sp. Cs237 TaxID=2985156 RepID=UPI0025771143|nr:hypothetical protein [Citrobacter sp. Cs237]MDM2748247.1 hypothetical protein [Citrobacter sp. Cs237]